MREIPEQVCGYMEQSGYKIDEKELERKKKEALDLQIEKAEELKRYRTMRQMDHVKLIEQAVANINNEKDPRVRFSKTSRSIRAHQRQGETAGKGQNYDEEGATDTPAPEIKSKKTKKRKKKTAALNDSNEINEDDSPKKQKTKGKKKKTTGENAMFEESKDQQSVVKD